MNHATLLEELDLEITAVMTLCGSRRRKVIDFENLRLLALVSSKVKDSKKVKLKNTATKKNSTERLFKNVCK